MIPTALSIGLVAGVALRWPALVPIALIVLAQGLWQGAPAQAVGAVVLVEIGYALAAVVVALPALRRAR